MQITGEVDGPPNRAGVSVVDLSTGMLAFGAAVTALYARATGARRGEHVQSSLLQSGLALMSTHVANLAIGGAEPRRQGSGLWSLVPYQAFKASDGWVLVGVTNDAAWQRFCAATDLRGLAENPAYATARGRIDHRDEIVSAIQAFLSGHAVEEVVAILEPARVPVSPVNTVREVLEHEQTRAIDAMVPVWGAKAGGSSLLVTPSRTQADAYPVRRLRRLLASTRAPYFRSWASPTSTSRSSTRRTHSDPIHHLHSTS